LQHADQSNNSNSVYLVHADTEKYLDAHSSVAKDYQALLEDQLQTAGGRKGQTWVLEKINDSPVPFLDGVFTITQDSTQMLLDADDAGNTLDCYTNSVSFKESQHFIIRRIKGEIYTIMQKSTGRFIGAQVKTGGGNAEVSAGLVLTDNTQQWMMIYVKFNTFVFQHVSTGRILDAMPKGEPRARSVFGAMPSLAAYDGNLTHELWTIKRIGFAPALNGIYRIVNGKGDRALQGPTADGSLVAAPKDVTEGRQYWAVMPIAGDIYEIYNNQTRQILSDGNQVALSVAETMSLVQAETSPVHAAEHPSEQWFIKWILGDQFYVMNSRTRKYLDADVKGAISTGELGQSGSETWRLEKVMTRCVEKLAKCPQLYQCGFVDDWCGGKVTCGSDFADSHSNGTCKGVNAMTGTPHVCNSEHSCECVPRTKCGSGAACGTQETDGCRGSVSCGACPKGSPAPAPMPAASPAPGPWPANSKPMASNRTCIRQCDSKHAQCGFVPDGCGSMLPCGKANGLCPANPTRGASFACGADHSCTCVKRTSCDKGAQCGEQSDGCGGMLKCGGYQGNCTGGRNFKCQANTCVCTPDKCEKRCGDPVDNGCGKKLSCKCTMANEVCDRKAGICAHVPGPTPDPKLFAPTNAPMPSDDKQKAGSAPAKVTAAKAPAQAPASAFGSSPGPSPAPNADVAPSPAHMLLAPAPGPAPMFVIQAPGLAGAPVFAPPNAPEAPPPQVPENLSSNMVEHYTYFYYVYYYYAYLGQKDAGATDAVAAAFAQKMAPIYAMEQLEHMLKATPPPTEAAQKRKALETPLPPLPAVALSPLPAFHILPRSENASYGTLQQQAFAAAVAADATQASVMSGKHAVVQRQRSALRGVSLSAG